jgi:hypothetical protein
MSGILVFVLAMSTIAILLVYFAGRTDRDLRTLSALEKVMPVLKQIVSCHSRDHLTFREYHGFYKATIPASWIGPALIHAGLRPAEVQAEIVWVTQDLRRQIHSHQKGNAVVVILNERYGFGDPLNASFYDGKSWNSISDSVIVRIPRGTPHGFTVGPGGELYFLSVQTPPISGPGHDDYVLVGSQSV